MRTTSLLVLFAFTAGCSGCSKKCAPGQMMAKGGKCVGSPLSEKVLNAPRAPRPKPRELAKRSPLAAPELKPLPALASHVFGGKTPRWFSSVDEVRAQTGLKEARLSQNVAWRIGLAYTLVDLRKIDDVTCQVDYFFMGDNLIGYDISFFFEEGKGQTLATALRAQAEKAYGPPKSKDDVNADWALPQLAVHMAVTSAAGLSQTRGHPVRRVAVSWTVPPDSVK